MTRELSYGEIQSAALGKRLEILGGFDVLPSDDLPDGFSTVVMLGPHEPGFWPYVTEQPEFGDGKPHPLDRWSARAVGDLADRLNGMALFPFGGPPYHPFFSWALRTGRCWQSPVSLLVHDHCGLFVSFRGALAFKPKVDLPEPPASRPCDACDGQPCIAACPVCALGSSGYDVQACKQFIGSVSGSSCLDRGCAVRRSCPAGRGYRRIEAQSRFHQIAFLNG